GTDELLAELRVRAPKAASVAALLVQNSDEVDRRVAAREQVAQRRLVVNVRVDELDVRQHEQVAVAEAAARRDARDETGRVEAPREAAPEETRPAEDADAAARRPCRHRDVSSA